MITFATLFLGLVTGPQRVELVAGDTVHSIELRLDDSLCAVDAVPPWAGDCDFGEKLRPHRLTAISRDETGQELDRVDQWINLPRARSEAGLVVERGDDGAPRARVLWESVEQEPPESVTVTLDDRALPQDPDGSYPLPRYDERSIHILRAELSFPGNLRSQVDTVLGGEFGDGLDVSMTAIPILQKRERELDLRSLQGLVRVGTEPAKLVAVERGPLDLVVVIERSAFLGLGGHGRLMDTSRAFGRTGIRLEEGDTVRFLSTTPRRVSHGSIAYDLFAISTPFGPEDGELPFLLTHAQLGESRMPQRVADAVATAGVQAAAGNRRRAVLLIVGQGSDDTSAFSVAEVQGYLEALHVPLVVWSMGVGQTRTMSDDRIPMVESTAWGPAKNLGSITRFLEAADGLLDSLSEQRILWLEGEHLPNAVELSKDAKGVELLR